MRRKNSAETIDLDTFTGHQLLYWIGMERNSFEIKKFVAEFFQWKYPNNSFWIEILKSRALLR